MTILTFLKDQTDSWWPYKKGESISYTPWHYCFQGEGEDERVAEGKFVFCDGQGMFRIYLAGIDVEARED